MKIFYSILSLLLLLTVGCHRQEHDPRLVRVADLAEHSYDEALGALDSIDPTELSTGDRHFYDLLTIKANDKNYNRHTSDSLILDVISYYDRHKDDPYYPEALYYGGRVYSDLGDYPTSLTYFQRAADILRDDDTNLNLKANVLSQTARLLTTLRLYNEAVPYVKESIEIDSILNDSIGLVYDLQLLGGIYLLNDDYDIAEKYLKIALKKGTNLPSYIEAKTKMHLAGVKHFKGEIDSALQLIRHTPELVSRFSRNTALSYAAQIYHDAGIMDTAYMYANALVLSDDETNKQNGYQVLLSLDFKEFAPTDSMIQYVADYRNILEGRFNDNQNQLSLTQQSYYNYQLHEREKNKAIKDKERLNMLLILAAFIILILLSLFLYGKYRNQKQIVRIQRALGSVNQLKLDFKETDVIEVIPEEIFTEDNLTDGQGNIGIIPSYLFKEPIIKASRKPSSGTDTGSETELDSETVTKSLPVPIHVPTFSKESLAEKLRKETLQLCENTQEIPKVSETILLSGLYLQFREKCNKKKPINETSEMWYDLQKLVTTAYPNFIPRLYQLALKNLTQGDINIVLLIKCGFRPSEMMNLLGITNGAVISRRRYLGQKIFGTKLTVNMVDKVIRLL